MSHAYHEGLPGFDARQVLHDGCPECEYRGDHLDAALAHMDNDSFARAWKRAYDWKAFRGGGFAAVGETSDAERPLLAVLWGVQVILERLGQPLTGEVPNGR